MSRRLIKRIFPNTAKIRGHQSLKMFGGIINSPNLWHLNRYSVAKAFSVGLAWAWVPIPFQMLCSAACAILFRANLAISVILVWITNPLTMPILYYFSYRVGLFILGETPGKFSFELSWEWLVTGMLAIWKPFLLGCFVCGVISSVFGYIFIQALWRLSVRYQWQQRLAHRRQKKQSS
ncbi:MAG: flagellar biosynthesis protein FlhF [Legionellales bacterium]|nr:flagellar biosynthesis protein FlhF [Legionellales bacterium]|tara:strand:+ start:254 stop:787 length:534 start_codon:yes stop_codon:yes gene_type:complete